MLYVNKLNELVFVLNYYYMKFLIYVFLFLFMMTSCHRNISLCKEIIVIDTLTTESDHFHYESLNEIKCYVIPADTLIVKNHFWIKCN